MAQRTCMIDGCGRRHYARGWCEPHYKMWRKVGDPCGSTRRDPVERFWSKVDRRGAGDCWLWTGGGRRGYGTFHFGDRDALAHRFSWALAFGTIPDGLHVCHRCDNPPCVNPSHLFLGTHAENMADRNRKGRQACLRGEASGSARLTESDVIRIREMLAAGTTQVVVAKMFGISQTHVSDIKRRNAWAHVGSKTYPLGV